MKFELEYIKMYLARLELICSKSGVMQFSSIKKALIKHEKYETHGVRPCLRAKQEHPVKETKAKRVGEREARAQADEKRDHLET